MKAREEEKPRKEVIEIHTETTRSRSRNASGAPLDGKAGTVIPVLGGIVGGTAAVLATQKWDAHPGLVAAGAAAAGLAAMSMGKQQWLRQAGAGAVVGAAVIGAVPMVVGAFSKSPTPQAHSTAPASQRPADARRSAEGDGYVTRVELNDALGKLADSHKEGQKQQTCDLLSALRDEIRKVVAEGPNGPGLPAANDVPMLPARVPISGDNVSQLRPPAQSYTYPFVASRVPASDIRGAYGDERDAAGDDYSRNAYGEDLRDAAGDDYSRNAYGDDIRDAEGDEYNRNAYAYDERDANGDDERDAGGYYDERDAGVDEEREAGGDDERDADGDD